jgi:hypothetical protein
MRRRVTAAAHNPHHSQLRLSPGYIRTGRDRRAVIQDRVSGTRHQERDRDKSVPDLGPLFDPARLGAGSITHTEMLGTTVDAARNLHDQQCPLPDLDGGLTSVQGAGRSCQVNARCGGGVRDSARLFVCADLIANGSRQRPHLRHRLRPTVRDGCSATAASGSDGQCANGGAHDSRTSRRERGKPDRSTVIHPGTTRAWGRHHYPNQCWACRGPRGTPC